MVYNETKFSVSRFNADSAPQPEGLRCVSVLIPDDVFHLQLLAGLVGLATKATNWEGEQADREAVALLWNTGYQETDWEGCMDCAGVEDCIATDEGVQAAINLLIEAGTQIPAESPYGQNLSDERLTQDLTSAYNPECDKDILWAQCQACVDFTNNAITDVFEQIEASSNTVELAKAALGAIPFVAGAEKLVGIDGALEVVNYYQEAIAEDYAAQFTVTPITGIRDVIAFQIFCACQDDCIITIEKVFEVMQSRLRIYTSVPSLEGFINLLEFLTGTEVDSSFVVDSAFFVAWAGLKLANLFFGQAGNHVLDYLMALSVSDANTGWTFMGDCPVVCDAPDFATFDPIGYPGGSVVTTDNMDGTWAAVFTAAQGGPDNAWRVVGYEVNGCCWNVVSIEYSATPENLDAHYICGAPTPPVNPLWYDGLETPGPEVGQCSSGVAAASVSHAFTITIVYSAC